MEQEGPINVRALRAKFQEDATLAQTNNARPTIAEKPKRLPPSGAHCSSLVTSILTTVEGKIPAAPPTVMSRDGSRRASGGGARPSSFPPPTQQLSNAPPVPPQPVGDSSVMMRQSLRDRHMPFVLPDLNPVMPNPAAPPVKIKKKGLLLPFKSTKAPEVIVQSREEPTYADLTTRPSSAPGELPSSSRLERQASVPSSARLERQTSVDRLSLQGRHSSVPSSPDVPVTPPFAETTSGGESENRFMSTLERAKKKLSRKAFLGYAKPRILCSDSSGTDEGFPLPPREAEHVMPDLPPPPPPVCLPTVCLPLPFFKKNGALRKSQLDKWFHRDRVDVPPLRTDGAPPSPPPPPQKKPLPDLYSLGQHPLKPPRPPSVDLYRHRPVPTREAFSNVSLDPSHTQQEKPEGVLPFASGPVLDAPDFPDFESTEVETGEAEVFDIDIAALELEASDFGYLEPSLAEYILDAVRPVDELQRPVALEASGQDVKHPEPAVVPDPQNLPEPPEPELCPDEEAAPVLEGQPDEFVVNALLNGGTQPQPSVFGLECFHETSTENVYEDVETVRKYISGCSSLKREETFPTNPYEADSQPPLVTRQERSNLWQRTWSSIEHSHSTHSHGRECHSPEGVHKEQKKRDKHRLDKERKEQKERDKKENEMKKKFKVTGKEEPMHYTNVMVTTKLRKNDLAVKSGDTVGIIRTSNCPKGRWLARDASHKYGYISVMNVELNIQEVVELGKKAQAAGKAGNSDADAISLESRSSNQPTLASSFTDDSEEWTCEEETLSPEKSVHQETRSQFVLLPEIMCDTVAQHTLSDTNLEELHMQTRHEALQRLAIFFHQNEDNDTPTPTNVKPPIPGFSCAIEEPLYPEQDVDLADIGILPPPPLYADTF